MLLSYALAPRGRHMESYEVVWSGTLEKELHDQQIKPAPPINEDRRKSYHPPGKSGARRVRLADSKPSIYFDLGLRIYLSLCGVRAKPEDTVR